jgi:hypothetical protein
MCGGVPLFVIFTLAVCVPTECRPLQAELVECYKQLLDGGNDDLVVFEDLISTLERKGLRRARERYPGLRHHASDGLRL